MTEQTEQGPVPSAKAKEPERRYTLVSGGVDEKTGKPKPIVADHGGLKDRARLKEVKRLNKQVPAGFACLPACGKCCETPVEMLRVEWEALIANPAANAILDRLTQAGKHVMVEARTAHAVRIQMKAQPNDPRPGVCPFLNPETKACSVFNDRPFVCRAYGQHWFFYCKEGVEAPKEILLDDRVMRGWSILAGKEFADRPVSSWQKLHEIVDAWRLEKPLERRDRLPGYDEIRAKFVAPEEPDTGGRGTPEPLPAATPRYSPEEFDKLREAPSSE